MAKSKKQDALPQDPSTDAATPKAPRKVVKGEAGAGAAPAAPAASKPAAKKSAKPAAAPSAPLVDTSLAAAAAAKLVANRDRLAGAETRGSSGLIKQLKDSLNKPTTSGPADFLHNTTPSKRSNLPFGGRKQVGHNQTFGADVNRSGIPRRTGG